MNPWWLLLLFPAFLAGFFAGMWLIETVNRIENLS